MGALTRGEPIFNYRIQEDIRCGETERIQRPTQGCVQHFVTPRFMLIFFYSVPGRDRQSHETFQDI